METSKTRVLMILEYFPQISQTYVKNEIEAVCDQYEVRVVGLKAPDMEYAHHHPFERTNDPARIREIIEEFRPHVLHSHYVHNAAVLAPYAEKAGIPFTVRAHSFDVIQKASKNGPSKGIQQAVRAVNSDHCLGVLTFPFTRGAMERAGMKESKLIDCWPVVRYSRFYDRSANGKGVINVGACLPKKRMEDFVMLGTQVRHMPFSLYPIGYTAESLTKFNEEHGSPVNLCTTIQPEEMPAAYKRHEWLVYTGCRQLGTLGWPMAVAEAQAAGLGVCMPNLRPDIKQYVGPAGFIYDSIEEVADIISRPYPNEMRERGFEHAKKSDIDEHKVLLTNLWDSAAAKSETLPSKKSGFIARLKHRLLRAA